MHVGVFLLGKTLASFKSCLPHARGGVSFNGDNRQLLAESSPCTWGCFFCRLYRRHKMQVFPMHVGVFPSDATHRTVTDGLPHARGGVSKFEREVQQLRRSSPCTWGCFWSHVGMTYNGEVFPMHVGVFPRDSGVTLRSCCLPHARGGVSKSRDLLLLSRLSSPCTWGCFCRLNLPVQRIYVFPMHVGVFPKELAKLTI